MSDQEVVIIGADGKEHVFPSGFDPRRAAGIVAQKEALLTLCKRDPFALASMATLLQVSLPLPHPPPTPSSLVAAGGADDPFDEVRRVQASASEVNILKNMSFPVRLLQSV